MTQEELNELMASGNLDDTSEESKEDSIDTNDDIQAENYRAKADKKWPPPPPTENHKVVHQLDDVTKGLEIKATQIFDQLEAISATADNIQKCNKTLSKHLNEQIELFEKLSVSFPNINTFKTSLQSCKEALEQVQKSDENANNCLDSSLQAMDIMQYQDIHRQKIERVVNVMRALAKYLNSILETDVDDDKRVSSAVYLAGDANKEVLDGGAIDDLIASLKK